MLTLRPSAIFRSSAAFFLSLFFVFDFTYVNVSFRCGWKREESCLSILLRKSVYSAPRVFLHAITFTLTRVKYEKNRPLPEPSRLQEGNRNSSQRNATNFRDRHSAPNTRAFILFGGGKKTKKLSGIPPSFAMVSFTHKYNNSANEIVFRPGQSVPPCPGRTVNETSTFVAIDSTLWAHFGLWSETISRPPPPFLIRPPTSQLAFK